MKLIELKTYAEFVENERPYYPVALPSGLLVANFAINDHITGMKAKNRLVVMNVPIINQRSFAAVYSCVLSCQGFRERWFYFERDLRIVWSDLSWDRRHECVFAFIKKRNEGRVWPEALPPTRKLDSYVNMLVKQGWL